MHKQHTQHTQHTNPFILQKYIRLQRKKHETYCSSINFYIKHPKLSFTQEQQLFEKYLEKIVLWMWSVSINNQFRKYKVSSFIYHTIYHLSDDGHFDSFSNKEQGGKTFDHRSFLNINLNEKPFFRLVWVSVEISKQLPSLKAILTKIMRKIKLSLQQQLL